MRARSVHPRGFIVLCAAALCALSLQGRASQVPPPAPTAFSSVTSFASLPDGIDLDCGKMRMRITALRDTVIRIRVSASQTLPEDASWAVLPEARHSSVAAVPDVQPGFVGFHTRALRVEVSRAGGMLTIRNSAGEIVEQDALPVTYTGTSFRVSKVMPADEHYFGLGDKTGGFDRRNHAFTLWNTDAYRFQESTDPIYKSIPFFLAFRAGSATGTLLDNTWRSSFDFGKESPDAYSFGAVNGPLDYYFFIGPSPRQVVETYAWLTGKPPLPPRWAFGFQQSRYTYTPEQRLLEVASRLRADKIPADALYLDIGFQDKNRSFTIDPQTFPDMSAVLQKLHAMHFHVVAITDLHIAKAAGQNYLPFSSGTASDRFVHNPDGSVYIGSVWPGPSVFPDFTQAATRAWWGTLYKPFAQLGFDGFWNDMNEPSVFNGPQGTMPLDVVHRIDEPGFAPRNASHAEIHNVYGMENSRATHDGLLALEPNLRPFVLTRASFAGGQRYAATWTGDNSSTWNHLRMTTPMLKNLGLSGFSFAGADVGGFAGTATPQLLTKWIEIGAFQPIDRDHSELGTGDQEPWIGGPEQEDIRRRYIEERYRLLPYLYTQAEESAQTGIPMERPLFLDYPDAAKDRHAIDLDPGADAEFLLGHDLLIAPAPYPEAPDAYTVEFPTAEWYDYWTGLRVAAAPASPASPNAPPDVAQLVPLSVRVTPALEKLPVYVRGGSIVPLQPLVQSTDEQPKGPLTLRVYTGDDCTGSLYTDDGRSLAYRNGGSLRMTFACTVDEDGLRLEISRHEGTYVPWWKDIRVEVYGWKPHSSTILLNGRPAAAKLEQRPNSVVFMVPDTGNGETVSLQ